MHKRADKFAYLDIKRDPLGFLDEADQEKFNKLRYAEIKHGRIAMNAIGK